MFATQTSFISKIHTKENVMKILYICFITLIAFPLNTLGKELELFFIQRSKNKNEVHYLLKVDERCRIIDNKPVNGIWKMLEEGPNETKPFSTFDSMAYSAENQEVVSDWVYFNLKALEERPIRSTALYDPKTNRCSPVVQVKINGKWSILDHIYVSSKEGFLMPRIMYIDIFGRSLDASQTKISERIKP